MDKDKLKELKNKIAELRKQEDQLYIQIQKEVGIDDSHPSEGFLFDWVFNDDNEYYNLDEILERFK